MTSILGAVGLLLALIVGTSLSARILPPTTTTVAPSVNYTGSYLIIAPKVFRGGLNYSVSVNVLQADGPVTVTLTIRDSKNTTVSQAVSTGVQAGSPATVQFEDIGQALLPEEHYRLYARGVSERSEKVIFENDQEIRFETKSLSIFVQTDKAIYKPGSTVHMRVIVVTPNLKPVSGKQALIKIQDPQQNVIAQETKTLKKKGVIEKDLVLSDEPPLGDWKIEVTVGSVKYEKTFAVDKYVLPKFDVKVKPPPFAVSTDDIPVLVTAKYTYGKGVQGSVTLRAEYPWASTWNQDHYPPISQTTQLDESGQATIRFSNGQLQDHNLINLNFQSNIKFTAIVKEPLTDIERNGTAELTVYKSAVKVTIAKPSTNFKPGLDYTFKVAAVQRDDTPLPSAASKTMYVRVTYYFPYKTDENGTTITKSPSGNTSQVVLGTDGTASMTIQPPLDAESIDITARYEKENSDDYDQAHITSAKSPTTSFIQLVANQGEAKTDDVLSFTIKATEEIRTVTAQVLSRGYVLLTKTVNLNGIRGDFSFPATAEMAPKSRVIVYTIRPSNKEILVDALDFKVKGLFENEVSIGVSTNISEPNKTVQFSVKAAPKSYVGLLSVDQSVLLLKSGNDITQEMVEDDIETYDTTGKGSSGCPWCFRGIERRKRSLWFPGWGISGEDPYSMFENSGVIVLTDAYLYRIQPKFVFPIAFAASGAGFNGPMGMAGAPAPPKPMAPMAKGEGGAMAASSSSADKGPGGPEATPPRIRTLFPETWIWSNIKADANGEVTYSADVPDTITSWITSAFAVSEAAGLGVAPEPAKLEVFRPFFIRLNLPYSVKRGEKLALQVLVFNYMETDQQVTVTLERDETSGFDFVDKPNADKESKDKKEGQNVRVINVKKSGGSSAAYFPIIPTIVGNAKFLVKAIASGGAGDAVEQPLIVEAEGYPLFFNKPLVLDLTKNSTFADSIKMELPRDSDIIPGSEHVEASVIGDIMGPILANIDQLIRMPYGCGEQNMLNFVPNIVVYRYLNATSRLTPELKAKTIAFMESGYQREMTYKRSDNSFSAFGNSDKHGSTWLTAFVLRSFKQAQPYTYVDPKILQDSLTFLKSQQMENGEFIEHGEVHHKDMQGGAQESGFPLTAYVLTAFLVNDAANPAAVNYLVSHLPDMSNDSYALAVTTYALHLAGHAKKDDALAALERLAKTDIEGMKYWSAKVGPDVIDKPWYYQGSRPVDIEMTSYVLLTYLLRDQIADGVQIVRWLSTQRNSLGGFSSTQDTVMGIQSLGSYAEKAYSPSLQMSITMKQGEITQGATINSENAIVLQKYKLNKLDSPVEISATGNGIGFLQVAYHYNVPALKDVKPFDCTKDVQQSTSTDMAVNLCCKYGFPGQSNMAVIQLDVPSGYTIDGEDLNQLPKKVHDLQRVELAKGDTQASIYFNHIGTTPVCVNVTSQRGFTVTDQKPAHIKVFDYYEPVNKIELEYSTKQNLALDALCPDCWNHAVPAPAEPRNLAAGSAAASASE